jgi:hypothetical protein
MNVYHIVKRKKIRRNNKKAFRLSTEHICEKKKNIKQARKKRNSEIENFCKGISSRRLHCAFPFTLRI